MENSITVTMTKHGRLVNVNDKPYLWARDDDEAGFIIVELNKVKQNFPKIWARIAG